MNDKKIAFIICTNNDLMYSECVTYLQNLELPEGFEAEVFQITDAVSMTSGYNEGMHSSDAKYKIYLHHDLFIVRTDFIKRAIDIFIKHPEIGIMGVLGTDKLVPNASYWDHWSLGQVYALDILRGYHIYRESGELEVAEVAALDGMILMTQYDMEWREDIFKNWDFYDISQCFEFARKGYKVAVMHEKEISCLHDCGYSKVARYDESREIFCKEYAEYRFEFAQAEKEEQLEEREKLLEQFKENINQLLKVDIQAARMLVERVYEYYRKENIVATLKVIFDIWAKEQETEGIGSFVQIGDTYSGLLEKYTLYKFLIRRVEFEVCEEAAEELFTELQEGRVTLQAVEEIIGHCCFDSGKIIEKLQEKLTEKERRGNFHMSKNPKISVLMPTYNHAKYVGAAIESVINQTYKDFEFIICDDASTDGTVEEILKYEKDIDEIHLFDENKGTRGDFLCERANGEYIAIINSDDVWNLDKLEKQMKVLEENPTAVGCFTWCETINAEGDITDAVNVFNVANRRKEEWMNYFYFTGNCFAHSSVLMRREVYCRFREKNLDKFRQLPDYYMWIRLVQEYEVIVLEEKLTQMRVVNEIARKNVSAASKDNLIRHFNEESYIWYKVISNMEDAYFKKAFQEQLIDVNVQNPIEIMCEKFFILLQAKVEYCKIAAFFFFYDHYDEMKETLAEHYGFTNKDMYQLVANVGPGRFIN